MSEAEKLFVHLQRPPEPVMVDRLRAQLEPNVRVTLGPELPDPARYHVLVAGRPEREELAASPALHTLVIPWAGVPQETRERVQDFPDVAVHNLHHNAVPVAEMAVSLLLAAAKFILPLDRTLRDGDWRPRYWDTTALLLEDRTALILGYGAIGRRVARICHAGLGMRVWATKRHVSQPRDEFAEAIHSSDALHDLLPETNALLICLPHTPETDGLIGAEELALLPPDALLVNVGRGPIVEEAALYRALRDGLIYAAGLDVWYNYPSDEDARSATPPSAFPFHELENVVMSPHRAGGTVDTDRLRMDHLARLLNGMARGEPPPNRVDLEAGY